jgi:hypothetical protein
MTSHKKRPTPRHNRGAAFAACAQRWIDLRQAHWDGEQENDAVGADRPPALTVADKIYLLTNRAAYRLDRATQKVQMLAAATEYGDRGSIGVDDHFPYWPEARTGEIKRVPRGGGAATVVVTGASGALWSSTSTECSGLIESETE